MAGTSLDQKGTWSTLLQQQWLLPLSMELTQPLQVSPSQGRHGSAAQFVQEYLQTVVHNHIYEGKPGTKLIFSCSPRL